MPRNKFKFLALLLTSVFHTASGQILLETDAFCPIRAMLDTPIAMPQDEVLLRHPDLTCGSLVDLDRSEYNFTPEERVNCNWLAADSDLLQPGVEFLEEYRFVRDSPDMPGSLASKLVGIMLSDPDLGIRLYRDIHASLIAKNYHCVEAAASMDRSGNTTVSMVMQSTQDVYRLDLSCVVGILAPSVRLDTFAMNAYGPSLTIGISSIPLDAYEKIRDREPLVPRLSTDPVVAFADYGLADIHETCVAPDKK